MSFGSCNYSCAPRLMPVGRGTPSSSCSNPRYNCLGPCNGKKSVNVHFQEPVCSFQTSSDCNGPAQSASICRPCELPAVNVNINMCPKTENAAGDCSQARQAEIQYEEPTPSSVVTPCCAGGVCTACDYTPRAPRCVQMNLVERTESLKPEIQYSEIPYPMDDRTTYRNFFNLKISERTKSCRPAFKNWSTGGKVQHASEYKYAYLPFPTIPYVKPSWAKQEEFKAIEGNVSGVTTYKTDYQRVVGRPADSSKPRRFIDPNLGPLEDRTTYKVDFPPHSLCDRAMSTKPDPIHFVPTLGVPFSGQTIYKTDYPKPCMTTAKSFKPKRYRNISDIKFDDETTYRNSYLPFAYQKCTPIDTRTCSPFDFIDSNKKEFGTSTF